MLLLFELVIVLVVDWQESNADIFCSFKLFVTGNILIKRCCD